MSSGPSLHDPTLSLSRPSRSYIVIVETFTNPHNYCHCRGLHDPILSLSRPSRSHILSLSRPSRSYTVIVEAFTIPHNYCHCRGLHDPTLSLSRPSRSHILSLSRPSRSYIVIVEAFTSLHCHYRGLHDPALSLSRLSRSCSTDTKCWSLQDVAITVSLCPNRRAPLRVLTAHSIEAFEVLQQWYTSSCSERILYCSEGFRVHYNGTTSCSVRMKYWGLQIPA